MLGQSTGTVCQSGLARSVALGDSDGSAALATLRQQHYLTAVLICHIFIGEEGDTGADSERLW
jgi:hypothetical protein